MATGKSAPADYDTAKALDRNKLRPDLAQLRFVGTR
jgi:hypothetical protein